MCRAIESTGAFQHLRGTLLFRQREQHSSFFVCPCLLFDCSDPNDPLELRNPNAYVAIGRAMGLSPEKAADVIYRNPQRALEHASADCEICSFLERRKLEKGGVEIIA